jgi:hypothetical protein
MNKRDIKSEIKLNKDTGLPETIIDCLPYKKAYKPKYQKLNPMKIDEYVIDFKHKNNTYTTFLASKYLKIEVSNAFLASKYVDFYAIASLHRLDLGEKSTDKRYFTKQVIKLDIWDKRSEKILMIVTKMLIVIGIGLFAGMFAFVALRKQEIVAEARMKESRK